MGEYQYKAERGSCQHQDYPREVAISCSWMDNWSQFENGKTSTGHANRLYQMLLFPFATGTVGLQRITG